MAEASLAKFVLADEQVPLVQPCTITGAEGGGEVATSPDESWHRHPGGGCSIPNQLRDDDAAQDALRGHVLRSRLLDTSRYRALQDSAGFDEVSPPKLAYGRANFRVSPASVIALISLKNNLQMLPVSFERGF